MNALASARPGYRPILQWIMSCGDHEISQALYNSKGFTMEYDDMTESLWSIMLAKTTGEAKDRVKAATQGDGIEGLRRMHRWFTMTSGLGLAEEKILCHDPTNYKERGRSSWLH